MQVWFLSKPVSLLIQCRRPVAQSTEHSMCWWKENTKIKYEGWDYIIATNNKIKLISWRLWSGLSRTDCSNRLKLTIQSGCKGAKRQFPSRAGVREAALLIAHCAMEDKHKSSAVPMQQRALKCEFSCTSLRWRTSLMYPATLSNFESFLAIYCMCIWPRFLAPLPTLQTDQD